MIKKVKKGWVKKMEFFKKVEKKGDVQKSSKKLKKEWVKKKLG